MIFYFRVKVLAENKIPVFAAIKLIFCNLYVRDKFSFDKKSDPTYSNINSIVVYVSYTKLK